MACIRMLVVGIALLASASGASAQRQAVIRGNGADGCGKYLQDRAQNLEPHQSFYVQWTWAYLSAYNVYSAHQPVTLPDAPTVLAFEDKFCRDNPLSTVAGAAGALIGELGGWRPASGRK